MDDDSELRDLNIQERQLIIEMTRTDDDRPKSAVEAFKRVYTAGGTQRTSINQVSKIMRRPHMVRAKATAEAAIEADRRRASRGNRQAIETALWKEATNGPESRDRTAALRALLSMQPKHVEEDPHADSAASKIELEARLQQLLAEVPDAIDITPRIGSGEHDEADETDDIEAEIMSLSEPDY